MAHVKFDPFRGFENMAKKMNRLIDEADKGLSVEFGSFAPRIDIVEDDKAMYFSAELPGIAKEDVKVSIADDNVLYIKGEKKPREKAECEKCYLRVERNYGAFNRSFMLPDNINAESIKAKFDNGVLEISFEKVEPEKPKEINVDIL